MKDQHGASNRGSSGKAGTHGSSPGSHYFYDVFTCIGAAYS
jgi:hypothetical protein